eukprot:TRINITY_DN7726_c0_g1_i1.p1 TRINITY_DN7726_c0_g1~~TRINITY_DN7726_c0_g1_i1.p1  ORF type:complete len:550 (+),score=128.35 TRINITY_DN7726_c0_g1_i1:78-1727(+)
MSLGSLQKGRTKKEKLSGPKILSSIEVNVAEGRNLKDSESYFCVVSFVNNIWRTRVVAPSTPGEPFWGEDFEVLVDTRINTPLVVTTWDAKPEILGQLTIPSRVLNTNNGTGNGSNKATRNSTNTLTISSFFPLSPITSELFVTGSLHVLAKFCPPDQQHNNGKGSLYIKVIEAKDLAFKNPSGNSDPFVKITVGDEKQKTKVIKRNLNPVWNQDFDFIIKDPCLLRAVLSVHDRDRFGTVFMGQAELVLFHLEPYRLYEFWLPLQPPESTTSSPSDSSTLQVNLIQSVNNTSIEKIVDGKVVVCSTSAPSSSQQQSPRRGERGVLGDVRIKVKIEEIVVLTYNNYEPFHNHLLSMEGLLVSKIIPPTEHYARTALRIFESKGQGIDLLKAIIQSEIEHTQSSDIIFRANTIGSKMGESYIKHFGMAYLKTTLSGIIKEIYSSRKQCEIDPSKAEKSELAQNLVNLTQLVQKTLSCIFGSHVYCPIQMRRFFSFLRSEARKREWKDPNTQYTVVSSFLFLRFFCAALLGPKLFDLIIDHPDPLTSRTLR